MRYMLVLVVSICFFFCQNTSFGAKETLARQIEAAKIKNNEGWEIPLIKQSSKLKKVKTEIALYPGPPLFSIEITTYHPRKAKKKDLELQKLPFFTIQEKELHIEQAPLLISEIVRYSINNQTFGYLVVGYSIVKVRHGVDLGAQYTFYYFDTDGDGKFETLEYEPGLLEDRVPKWVIPNEETPKK